MPQSLFTDAYATLLETLIQARQGAGLTQAELSERLGRPQPFISKVERGVRRLDVIEFYALARALGADPVRLFAKVVNRLPRKVEI
ncbi:MAG: helix-turn-helix domain-containing protein [Terricaulis sp.]|nr:helix-turn-helix domain-containing protein [Terricaulis sp.]